jgi:ankyrin repeat protein
MEKNCIWKKILLSAALVLSTVGQSTSMEGGYCENPYIAELEISFRIGDVMSVASLIREGKVNVATGRNDHCQTLLHIFVCLREYNDTVEFILENDLIDVNVTDFKNRTPLYFAVKSGRLDIVELLLMYGAYVDARSVKGRSPLHSAAKSGYFEMVELLVKYGANVNVRDNNGYSPLDMVGSDIVREFLIWLDAEIVAPPEE